MNITCSYCQLPMHYFRVGVYCYKCGLYISARETDSRKPTLQQLVTYLPTNYDYGILETTFDGKQEYSGYYISGVKVPFYPYEEAKAQFKKNAENNTPCKLVRLSRYLVDDKPVPIEIIGAYKGS